LTYYLDLAEYNLDTVKLNQSTKAHSKVIRSKFIVRTQTHTQWSNCSTWTTRMVNIDTTQQQNLQKFDDGAVSRTVLLLEAVIKFSNSATVYNYSIDIRITSAVLFTCSILVFNHTFY